ncbi:hypothetical protein Droror1_Dr00005586 [Drosera rotundifolia]
MGGMGGRRFHVPRQTPQLPAGVIYTVAFVLCISRLSLPISRFSQAQTQSQAQLTHLGSHLTVDSIGAQRKMKMGFLVIVLQIVMAISFVQAQDAFVGVNIGTSLSDMPDPTQVVALLKSQHIKHVRLYNADRGMLLALANTGIQVVVSVPNDQILSVGQSNATAANWVSQNVVAHYPATNITAICVGSEVLTSLPNAAPILVNALRFIQSALMASNLDAHIKVSTPLSSTMILDSFPPSQAFFNHSWNPVLVPMLKFLQSTGSSLMINVYPYYDYMQSNGVIPLDYALFQPLPANKEAVDSNTLLHYTNVFDATVDAAYFAMADLNFTNTPVMVTESGWPSKGDPNEPDATLENANTYNSNLIKHVLNKTGTPKHPGIAVSTFVYELYNEDLKPGPLSEKNWGLFDENGKPIYVLHLLGSGSVLANDTTNLTYCAVRDGADEKLVQAALDWACGAGMVDCSPLLQGQPCYEPDNVIAHATYAFDTYYQKMGRTPEACNFNGVAEITTTNLTHGTCVFPTSGVLNSTFLANASAPSISTPSKTDASDANGDFSMWATAAVLLSSLFL